MNESILRRLSLILILVVNAIVTILYFFLYRDLFFYFLIFLVFLVFIDLIVIINYLRYLSSLNFEGDKISYKNFLFRHEFLFSDIVSVEKRIVDKMLILTLNNKIKIKVYYLEDFYNELKKKRKDLFILNKNEMPTRYYVSYSYVIMLFIRIGLDFVVYYISLENILIFIFIFLSTFSIVLNDILAFSKLIVYYEFRKDFLLEKKIFSSKKYYYKFFEESFIKNKDFNDDVYFSFLYAFKSKKRIYVKDRERNYSMQKAFEYVNKCLI